MLQISNLSSLEKDITQLEEQTSSSDLWDDPSRAQDLVQRLNGAKARLKQTQDLQALLGDVQTAVELAGAEVRDFHQRTLCLA